MSLVHYLTIGRFSYAEGSPQPTLSERVSPTSSRMVCGSWNE